MKMPGIGLPKGGQRSCWLGLTQPIRFATSWGVGQEQGVKGALSWRGVRPSEEACKRALGGALKGVANR